MGMNFSQDLQLSCSNLHLMTYLRLGKFFLKTRNFGRAKGTGAHTMLLLQVPRPYPQRATCRYLCITPPRGIGTPLIRVLR